MITSVITTSGRVLLELRQRRRRVRARNHVNVFAAEAILITSRIVALSSMK